MAQSLHIPLNCARNAGTGRVPHAGEGEETTKNDDSIDGASEGNAAKRHNDVPVVPRAKPRHSTEMGVFLESHWLVVRITTWGQRQN